MSPPIAVIGAGVIGMACARALQRAGARVLVLDPNEPGSGCSFGNAGHIAIELTRPLARPDVLARLPRLLRDPLGPLALKPSGLPRMAPWMLRFGLACLPGRVAAGTAVLAALIRAAGPAWREEIAASGLEDLFRHQGALILHENRASLDAALSEAPVLAAHGLRVENLGAAEAAARVPLLRRAVAGAQFFPDASHVADPQAVVLALARRFVAEGGAIERRAATGFVIEGGKVRAVRGDAATIAVSGVVLAAGVRSAPLARMLGVAAPLARERGYHVMVEDAALAPGLPLTFAERGFVVTPMTAGTRLAGTVELGVDAKPDWRRAEILLAHARVLFGRPDLAASGRWFGDRPTLPDYRPMIGSAPRIGNAAFALGHQHLGLTFAAVTGRLVVDCLLRGGLAEEWAACRPGRFG